ncbi:MAG TPA: TolC family protein [Candidatus Obscuribacterales bacterium]
MPKTALGAVLCCLCAAAGILSSVRQALAEVQPAAPAAERKGPEASISMRQACDETLLKSPRAAAIRQQLGIAKSEYWRATELPNPQFQVYNGYKAEQTYLVGVTIPIEPPWQIVLRMILAKNVVKQTDLDIWRALWQLRGQVRRTYTELVVAQETYETLTELAELARRLQEVATKRFQAGDVPELDVLKARLATSQADIEREQGARRVVQARQQLVVIMGRPVQEDVTVPRLPTFKLRAEATELLPDFEKPMPALADFISQAMVHRPELKVVQQSIKTAEAALKNAYGKIWPTPQLYAGHAITGNPPTGPKLNGYTIQIVQGLPTLNVQQGDIALQRARVKQLKAELQSQKNIVTAEVSAAYQRLLAARERIRVYQEHVLADSSEVARLARRSYEVGQSDITSTLQAQQQNIQVRNQYLNAVLEYQLAFTDLEQSIGRTLQ